MKEGIYSVVFESNMPALGEGIIVVSDGCIHGGDMAFTCRGVLRSPEVLLEVYWYDQDIPSMLGMEGDYILDMRYQRTREGEYTFTGQVRGKPERGLNAYALFLTPLMKITDRIK
ncbi:nucleoside transporter [Salmonella enterica subsp. enterica serovar Oranienburg]|nr:nucleoside transporter [Salmonella enterica subsp. enterica serovar Oranienburg]